MDYRKIHDQIIQRSSNRKLACYTEKHHIIPRCMGGGNESSNIAILTPEEHFVIHQLLVKIYPNNRSLAHACQAMSMASNGKKVGGKLYGWLKRKISKAKSGSNGFWFGKEIPKEIRAKISRSNLGKKRSQEFKNERSIAYSGENNPHYGKTQTKEVCAKISQAQTGRKRIEEERLAMSQRMMGNKRGLGYKHSQASKIAMSERKRGEKHHLYGIGHSEESKIKMRLSKDSESKKVKQLTLSGEEIGVFNSIREASRSTGIAHQSISSVCRGRQKQAGRFLWKFEK